MPLDDREPRERFAIDFHVHTSFSFDSLTPPRVTIEAARRRGLAGIAITDHETVAGALMAIRSNPYPEFLIIPGIEVNTELGDLIGLYVTHDVKSRRFGEAIEEIHAQGGVTYVPHPLRTPAMRTLLHGRPCCPGVDLWEAYNGRYDRQQLVSAKEAFAHTDGYRRLCGSDAHFPWEIGIFRALLDELPRTAESLLRLSECADLVAAPRKDLALRAGITLGALVKAHKRRRYAEFSQIAVSLPWKTIKRIAADAVTPRD